VDALPIPHVPRPLGRSSLRAFPLAFGCWRMVGSDVAGARRSVEAALELGIDLFDLADVYGLDHGGSAFGESETLFGRVLEEAPALRDRMLLATKGGIVPGVPYDSSPRHLADACEASLRRLRVDVIDLYQIHRPDLLAHPHAVAAELARLREHGKIREVGVSNFTPAQFESLQHFLPFPIATHQPELSCFRIGPLSDGLLDQCLRERVTPLAWSPLAGGRLAADAEDGWEPRLAALARVLGGLAEREKCSRAAVALAWLLAHPAGIVPIVGSQRPERLREAARALDVKLTRTDWYAVLAAARGEPLP
jgi:predicted oxidoreductase